MLAFGHALPERAGGPGESPVGLAKKLQSQHFGMHMLERALFAYADTRRAAAAKAAARAVKGKLGFRALFRQPTDPDAGATVAQTGQQIVSVSNFITLSATEEGQSPTAAWDPSGTADADSDDEGDHPSSNVTREVLSVRNSRLLVFAS